MRGRVVATTALLFLGIGCLRGVLPPGEANHAKLELMVHLDQSYRRAEIRVLGADGGRLFSQALEFPDGGFALVRSSEWHSGPGTYAVSLAWLRSDGGVGEATTSFEMRPEDVVASGSATFFDSVAASPQLNLDLIERTPRGVRLERTSPISREGAATYVLRNESDRTLYPDLADLALELQDGAEWRRLGVGWCSVTERGPLNPGQSVTLDVSTGACNAEPLPPGRFRHSILINTVRRAPAWETYDDPAEITRSLLLSEEFDGRAITGTIRAVLPDVPVAQLRLGAWMEMSDEFSAQVLGPDGGSACICRGSIVGRERLRATAGIGGPCLTENPDASTVICVENLRRREMGDHPPYGKPWD